MAKATAICTCAECGTKFEKTKTCYNRKEADSWEQWAVNNYTQCPACWGKQQRQKETETPLTLNINIDPFSQKVILHFSGNTMSVKDNIKSIGGYFWQEIPMHGFLGALETRRPPLAWCKICKFEELETELKKVEFLNPILKNNISEIDIVTYAEIKKKNDAIAIQKSDALKAIKKPVVPEKLCGKTWNQKIYGKSGSYCFYSDNVKITLTDAEAKEIEQYLKEKAEYKAKIAEIEKQFN